jgi:hypothetical protein
VRRPRTSEARDGFGRDTIWGSDYGQDGYDVAFIDRGTDQVKDIDWF